MVKVFDVSVTTPDSLLDFKLKHGSTGRQLYQQVCTTINLREIWYFGLQYTDAKNVTKWVKLNKKISPINKSKNESLKFVLKVKFYPEEISEELIEDITKKLFYLQLKSQIISGEIYCSADAALLLASYQAVSRFGCFSELKEKSGYLKIPCYIPEHILEQFTLTHEDWEAKIARWHEQHGYMTPENAIVEYLKVVQDLEMYGVTYYPIKNIKQTALWIGIDALGLSIYNEDDRLNPKIGFPWSETRKLQYNHAKFIVKPTDPTAKDLIFYTENTAISKEVLALCTGNHELYARRRRPDTIEMQQMKAKAKELNNARELQSERLLNERQARELTEARCLRMERAIQERELENEMSKSTLSEYQRQVQELERQLEEEKRARLEMKEMQLRLEEMNQRLEMESMSSLEERQRLTIERDEVMEQIESQRRLLQKQEEQKAHLETRLAEQPQDREVNGDRANSIGEQELQCLDGFQDPEDDRQAMTATNLDHAKRLEIMRADLSKAHDKKKQTKIDIQYEKNLSEGVDKYHTLRAIRQGNTKKRVDQFESM